MIQPLTPQEKADLNAWILEHVDGIKILREHHNGYVFTDRGLIEKPNYTNDWSAAGPLFDRYPGMVLLHLGTYSVTHGATKLAQGTTGPEAIAKAVKQYEEQRCG